MITKTVKLGKLEVNLKELAYFLVDAKKNCYAGEGKEEIIPDGSKRLIYQKGNFHYTDNYAGYYQAPGTEIVRWKNENGQRIWQMSYSGGIFPQFIKNKELVKQTFEFLKEMLLEVKLTEPFRGPEKKYGRNYTAKEDCNGKEWRYSAITDGDIKYFKGEEEINVLFGTNLLIEKTVFSQNYIGGLIIPK